jgi:hypothetical protein
MWATMGAVGFAVFLAIQFVRPAITHPPVTGDLIVPPEVKQVLRTSCYDCHSNETKLAWFDEIAPAYWLVASDVKAGRRRLNFSEIGALPAAQQKAVLYESVSQIELGAMPLPAYVYLHRGAAVSPSELALLKNYLNPAAPSSAPPASVQAGDDAQYEKWIEGANARPAVTAVANGIEFLPDYKNWHAISSTDRLDNQTMRVILGNDTAVKAIAENHTNPWPNGSSFAKVAWFERDDGQGHVRPGAFVQVEFMIRDSVKYAATKGWGWARWRGAGLTPYGKDAGFTEECIGCHAPVRNNDYVFTMPVPRQFDGGLPWNPIEGRVITSSVDRQSSTMSTLYGNDVAVQHSRATSNPDYPAGSALSLVTWTQREDPRWFGANIPRHVKSVEFVTVTALADGRPDCVYERYEGSPLKRTLSETGHTTGSRAVYLLSLRASVMP